MSALVTSKLLTSYESQSIIISILMYFDKEHSSLWAPYCHTVSLPPSMLSLCNAHISHNKCLTHTKCFKGFNTLKEVTPSTVLRQLPLRKEAAIHQVGLTTMLATSKYVLFPGHNHLLTTGTDDPTL